MNTRLSAAQYHKIQETPFNWLLHLGEDYELCVPLLWELIKRWDVESCAFRIRGKLVPFKEVDVCVIIGLRVVGQALIPAKDLKCRTRELFGEGETMNLDWICHKLEDQSYKADTEVENFTRLYILLAFGTFYFPTSTRQGSIHTDFISRLDDLQSLHDYAWGSAVYEFCVKGFNQAADKVNAGNNKSQISMIGCAAALQVLIY